MAKDLKVVLLGYMGSGKSTIGRALAKQLATSFIDLDDAISETVAMPIPEIFKKRGELFFRKKETEVLNGLLDQESGFVLALGGGTPCYANNMEAILKRTEQVYYLKLSIGTLVERLSLEKDQRPLIARIAQEDLPEFIGEHLFERAPFYNLATAIINGDGKSETEVVDEILGQLGQSN